MASHVERVVDAHIHLWDPARTDWYPYLTGLRDVGMGDLTGWARYFDQKIYFAESANWNVEKFVHVAAASDFVGETWRRRPRRRRPGIPTPSSAGSPRPGLSPTPSPDSTGKWPPVDFAGCGPWAGCSRLNRSYVAPAE
jgi:hypothetical protein